MVLGVSSILMSAGQEVFSTQNVTYSVTHIVSHSNQSVQSIINQAPWLELSH